MDSRSDSRPTLVARCPEDALALARVVLGFEPSDSIVMLTFGAEHTFHARLDLPQSHGQGDALGAADEISAGVEALIKPAVQHGVESVLLMFYSDDPVPVRRMLGPLRRELRRVDIRVIDALRADGQRWFPLIHSDGGEQRGVAYDIDAHPFIVEAVLSGRVTRGTREDLAASIAPDPAGVGAIESALVTIHDEDLEMVADGGGWLRKALTASPLGDRDLALVLLVLQDRQMCDAAWCLLTRDGARTQVEVWSDVVRRAPRRLVAAPAAILGWAAWMAGDGALAWCAVDRCTRVNPQHPMVLLLAATLTEAVPPRALWG